MTTRTVSTGLPFGIALLSLLSASSLAHAGCTGATPAAVTEPIAASLGPIIVGDGLYYPDDPGYDEAVGLLNTGGAWLLDTNEPLNNETGIVPLASDATPSSLGSSIADCVNTAFGAPVTASMLSQSRDRLQQLHQHLQAWRTQPGTRGSGLQFYAQAQRSNSEAQGDAGAGPGTLRMRRFDVNVGVDHRINDQWAVGGAIGLSNPALRWRNDGSRVDGQGGNATVYGNWSPTASSYVAAAYSLDSTHYTVRDDDGTKHYATGVSQGLSLSAGIDVQQGRWTLSPYARADMVSAHIGSFGSSLGATRGRTDAISVGGQVQTPMGTSWGVMLPHARIELTRVTGWHIQGDSADAYASGGAVLPTPNPLAVDRQYGSWGTGLSALLSGGTSLFADYDRGFAQRGVSSWRFTLGLRSEL